jgi:K+/H+ antiporter YhaU regulatory subunit KhtT
MVGYTNKILTGISPNPYVPLQEDSELVLIGTADSEKKLLQEFSLNR